jgi:hypothetical protein
VTKIWPKAPLLEAEYTYDKSKFLQNGRHMRRDDGCDPAEPAGEIDCFAHVIANAKGPRRHHCGRKIDQLIARRASQFCLLRFETRSMCQGRLFDAGRNMRRREFITRLTGAAAAIALSHPHFARAQQENRIRRIGVMEIGHADDPVVQARIAAGREELEKLGWQVGRNLAIDYRWASRASRRDCFSAMSF